MSDKTRLVGLKKGDINDPLYKGLFVDDSGYRLISSSPKVFSAIHPEDFTENFYISEGELKAYVDGFIESVNENIQGVIDVVVKNTNADNSIDEQILNDVDIKLSLYRSFKSLYDKWISNSDYKDQQTSNYFYNAYSKDNSDNRMLYEHFNFVNRCGSDVGKKAVIDFAYLSNLANTKNGQGPTQSLYESITGVLSKNNFNFLPLPGYISYSKEDDSALVDMFRSFDGPLTNLGASPKFVCMFVGGSSRSLDIPRSYCGINGTDFEYKDDSFDIFDPTTYPADFNNAETGGITAFKVRYGQETQNHFSKLELDQAEFRETQDSLLVIDSLVNPSSGSDPTQIGKGNNLYDVNLTRGYTCKIETLGNMQIQPTMFFKLENVPMFRGTYLITDVTHSIAPHNVKTNITATRQPIITVPIVTEALSLLDLSLVEVVQTGNVGGNVDNGTTPQNNGDNYDESTVTTFDSITDCVTTSLNSVKNDGSFPIIIKGCYTAKDLGGDALHSFNTRKSDKFGGYMFVDSEVPSNFSNRVKVGTQGGVYAGKGVNTVLKELNNKGIKVKVSKIEINIDWSKYFVSWSVTIDKSTDEKSHVGVATRGSIGNISSGDYASRADSQIPTLKSDNPEFSNWISPKIIYNGNIMATGYLEDPKKQLRQYFLAYTKA